MTAPDRIYAHEAVDNGPCDGWDFEGTWHVDEGANGGVPFIRADIHAALQAENERLRDALQRIVAASKFWSEYPDGNDAIRYAHDSTHRLARAALE